MSTILDEIAAKTRLRVEAAKARLPLEKLRELLAADGAGAAPAAGRMVAGEAGSAPAARGELPFEAALRQSGLSFICEVKKASPSKGVIAEDFPWLKIAEEYEEAGAAAISVLTEPDYFMGSDLYLRGIAAKVSVPCLRKDFTIDSYQIYEAKYLGAGAVLFICALLDAKTLTAFIKTADEIGLSALVEIHNEEEAKMALDAGAVIIGINNRDLKTFKVDFGLSGALKKMLPPGILTVAESGVNTPEDIASLKQYNFDAVLIGETLMRAKDRKKFLEELKTAAM